MSNNYKIESKNGEKEIMRVRRLTREQNRKEDMSAIETLIKFPLSKCHGTRPKIKSDNSNRMINDPSFDHVVDRGNKIVATICRYLQDYDGFEGVEYDNTSTVTEEQISEVADAVINPKPLTLLLLQLMIAREPNRQTSDENVQFDIRVNYLTPLGWKVEKLVAGHLTLKDGDWVYDDAAGVASDGYTKARSIDFRMTKGDITVVDFAKFALIAGGGQGHQIKESKYFLPEVIKYIDKHPNEKVYFTDTLDGGYAEKFIEEHRSLIKGYENRVFVGNTEQVIAWVSSLK